MAMVTAFPMTPTEATAIWTTPPNQKLKRERRRAVTGSSHGLGQSISRDTERDIERRVSLTFQTLIDGFTTLKDYSTVYFIWHAQAIVPSSIRLEHDEARSVEVLMLVRYLIMKVILVFSTRPFSRLRASCFSFLPES